MDKGTVSNLLSSSFLLLSFFLPEGAIRDLLLSASLFAFSGGITNSLAVKMLFDRIPGLVGSGVIQLRFKEIREEIKLLIMVHFFNEEDLRDFMSRNKGKIDWSRYIDLGEGGQSPVRVFIEKNWEKLTSPEKLRPVIKSQVDRILGSPFGALLGMVGRNTIEDIVGGFVRSFADQMKEQVLEAGEELVLDSSSLDLRINVDNATQDIQRKVNELLEQKLLQLKPSQVKMMVEDVIRNHLGWLVVWGNVFGGLIGVLAYLVR